MTASLKLTAIAEPPFRHLDLSLPKNSWVAVTGGIATGKRRLIAHVLYNECQRRFLATLPPYWQQQLTMPSRPQLGQLSGAMPAILWDGSASSEGAGRTVGEELGWRDAWQRLLIRSGQWQCPVHQTALTTEASLDLPSSLQGRFAALCLPPLVSLSPGLIARCQRLGLMRLYQVPAAVNAGKAELVDITANLDPNARYQIVADIVAIKSPSQLAAASERALAAWDELVSAHAPLQGLGRMLTIAEAFPDMTAQPFEPPLTATAAGQCPETGCGFSIASTGEVGEDFSFGGDSYSYFAARRLESSPPGDGISYHQGCRLPIGEALALLHSHGMPADALAISQLEAAHLLGLGELPLHLELAALPAGFRQRLELSSSQLCSASDYLLLMFYPSAGLDPAALPGLVQRLKQFKRQGNSLVVVDNHPLLLSSADHVLTLAASSSSSLSSSAYQPPTVSWQPPPALTPLTPPTALAKPPNEPSWYPLSGVWELLPRPMTAAQQAAQLELPVQGCLGIVGNNGAGKTRLLTAIQTRLKQQAETDARDTPSLRLFAPSLQPKALTTMATLLGVWQPLRRLYSRVPEAVALGVSAKDFMAEEYRCAVCQGRGLLAAGATCTACQGSGLSHRLSGIRYRDLSLSQLLALPISQLLPLVARVPSLYKPLAIAAKLPGLSHLRLAARVQTLSASTVLLAQLAGFLSQGPQHRRVIVAVETCGFSHLAPADARALFRVLSEVIVEQERGLIFTTTQQRDYHAAHRWLSLSDPFIAFSSELFSP